MRTLIDLSRTLDPANRELVPEAYKALEAVLAPKIHYLHPSGEGLDRMTEIFGCPPPSTCPTAKAGGRTGSPR